MTLDDFITKARFVHGDKYDYSKVEYVNNKTRVCIICPNHGAFNITPNAHLNGVRCPECDRLCYKAERKIEELVRRIALPLPKSFVAIDFETLYPQPVSACSVGMVKYKNGKLVDHYYSLIKPPKEYKGKKGTANTRIHHITEAQVEFERTMAEIIPEMERFAEGLPLVAHHATTEKCCIKDTAEFYGFETNLDYCNIYDTQDISELIEITDGFLISGTNSHTLDSVCNRFGVVEQEHHNALDDARVCGDLFNIFIQKLGEGYEIKWPLKEVFFHSVDSKKTKPFAKEKYRPEDQKQRTDIDTIPNNKFKGKAVCLTGFTETESQEYGHTLHLLGATLKKSVSGKTDVLICGPKPGPSKIAQAKELNIEIINEEELLHLINHECIDIFK